MDKYLALIDSFVDQGILKDENIIKAFKKIKRQNFVLPEDLENADINAPLSIGHEQTISQPLTVAIMLELLGAQAGEKVLDVGSGSGWSVALLAEIVGPEGIVFGVERVPELAQMAKSNTEQNKLVSSGRVKIIQGDGTKGLPVEAPFDKIIVAAASREIPPDLMDQLKIGGRLLIPVGCSFSQDLVLVTKTDKQNYKFKRHPAYVFVPLIED